MSDVNNRPTILTKDSRGRASLRRYSFPSVLLDGATAPTANLIIAAPDHEELHLSSLVFTDASGGTSDIALYITTNAAPVAGDIVFRGKTIENSEGYLDLSSLFFLNPGHSLFATASSANDVLVTGWVTAYL